MKAFTQDRYGPPDVLKLTRIAAPAPGRGEVLVRVRATSVQPYDWHHMRGEPRIARVMPGSLGLRRPKPPVLGADVAGQVEQVGEGVTRFRPGDEVFALLTGGGFAEYVCAREDDLAPKPPSLSFEQAAAVPLAAVTALLALRDQGRVRPGHGVLVNGASGGVGTFAVQIARALGARVTGVCGARNADLVRSLGAAEVVDYAAEDFTRSGRRHDLLVDIAGTRSAAACRRALTPKGTCVVVGGPAGRWLQPAGHAFAALLLSPLVSQRMVMADVVRCTRNRQNLVTLTALIEDGEITPVIDRGYAFEDIPEALRYQEKGHSAGKVVVTV
ncbi:NAD(P)-dependent alcohol dehydrogenase [Actinomadura rubrisoli]|uniref:NAD(P)-dependent alcohol dehydrogenase n=1 Tax=Actinomadura rubrisoli TaxID=2530368 RepID=A0A4R4ZTP5_9ACTN|nr:NAD(P)-dependent alcohol dehydrogenase [Actinomadura rubrisoli]TDD62463.1 NAD(P)-dependent alcohol dehydrogenase [Actinomadura rubrisoli]